MEERLFRASFLLLIYSLAFSLATPYLGAASAQEKAKVDVTVKGYDGSTAMTASLIDSRFNYVENKTVFVSSFSFSNLTMGTTYIILLNYKGVPYTAEIDVNQSSLQREITVYELTSSDDDIIIGFHHVALTRGDGFLNVTEIIQFENVGSKVANGSSLKIAMPKGFKNFQSSHSCCVERTDFGFFFIIPQPILPNETQMIDLKYRLDPETDEYTFVKRAYYDTAIVIVTVAADDLKVVSSQNLNSEGVIDLDRKKFDAYSLSNLFAGDGFSVTVAGYKTAGLDILWLGTGVLLIVIIGASLYGFRGTRVSLQRLEAEEVALNSVLAELDKDFAEGKLKEVEYLRLKLKYKERLEKVKVRIKEFSRVKRKS